jgi:hypothetical protein
MSYIRPQSPPPPVPSPQLLPTPLPSPPALSRVSRRRLRMVSQPTRPASPPIPPRLIGSPLLEKTLTTSRSFERIDDEAKAALWVDGHEFGSSRTHWDHKETTPSAGPSLSVGPTKRTRRVPPIHTSYLSPPPSPKLCSPTPPVPPIPAFALIAGDKKPVLHIPPPPPTWPAKIIPEFTPTCAERIESRRKRGLSVPHSRPGLTCSQFMTMHSSPRRMGIKA